MLNQYFLVFCKAHLILIFSMNTTCESIAYLTGLGLIYQTSRPFLVFLTDFEIPSSYFDCLNFLSFSSPRTISLVVDFPMLNRLLISEYGTFFLTRSQTVNLSSIDRTTLFRFEVEAMLTTDCLLSKEKTCNCATRRKNGRRKLKISHLCF